jgi:hypothetical protein
LIISRRSPIGKRVARRPVYTTSQRAMMSRTGQRYRGGPTIASGPVGAQ